MQEQGKSASERQAEVLEWMGTAYGRRRIAGSAAQSKEVAVPVISNANSSTAFRPDWLAGYLAAIAGYKRGVTAGLVGLLAIAIAVALVQARASDSVPDVTQTATSTQADPQATASALLSKDADRQAELERAASEAKMQLASEHEARIALEGQVGQLASELAAQKLNRENAEQANATTSAALAAERKARAEAEDAAKSSKEELAAQKLNRENIEQANAAASAALAAERKARVEAEDAAKSSHEALARMESSAAAAPVAAAPAPVASPQAAAVPVAAAPVPLEATQAESKPVETRSPPWEANVRVVNASLDVAANSDAATSALLEGEMLFAKGDLEEARQRFEQAARMGLPEAALALGNTYDRVSLAKAGLNRTGDPTRARQWYRRALELAQIHQEPRR